MLFNIDHIKLRQKKGYWFYVTAFLIVVFALFVHLYRLDEIPFGINVDEIGMGYDAFCLGNWGIDRYFDSFPVYLTNYGGGQSALYAYLDIIPIKLLGLNITAIRLPGVILYAVGILFGACTFRLVSDSYVQSNRTKALFYLFLTAVLPVFVMLFRIGMDCNLMLAVGTILFYYLIKASLLGKNRYFFVAGVMGGVILYTYAIAYIVMPLFIIAYLIHMVCARRIKVKNVFAFGVPIAILAFPLVLVQIVNMFDLDQFQLGIFTITDLPNYRSGEISLKNISATTVVTTIKSIFGYDILRYNSLPAFGTIYYISIPFAVAGLVKSIGASVKAFRQKVFCQEYLYLCWFMILFMVGCCTVANTNKMNAAFISVVNFIVEGVFMTAAWLENKVSRKVTLGVVSAVYAVFAAFFFEYYFGGQYKADYGNMEFFSYSLEEPLQFVMNDAKMSDKVTYMIAHEQTYPYFLQATKMSPYEYRDVVGAGRYRFSLPENIDYEANYIIPDTEAEIKQRLAASGFEEYMFENYTVYSYDMSLYSQREVQIRWDAGVDDSQCIVQSAVQEIDGEAMYVLVGWSYNEELGALWDEVYIMTGNDTFYAQKVERTDLVDIVSDESLTGCGLLFIIPKDQMLSGTDVTVKCIDKANQVIGTETFRVE